MQTEQATREAFIVVLDADRFIATPKAAEAGFDCEPVGVYADASQANDEAAWLNSTLDIPFLGDVELRSPVSGRMFAFDAI